MRVTVIGKNINVTPALREIVEKKISKMDKYFEPNVTARATLTVQKNSQIFEVTIPFNGVILRCEESTDDMYKSIDLVEAKLERQIRKNKTRLKAREEKSRIDFKMIDIIEEDEEKENKIIKRKQVEVKPMNEEEAILQMELIGHQFYLFKNIDTSKEAVVYKRKNGGYGLIEAE